MSGNLTSPKRGPLSPEFCPWEYCSHFYQPCGDGKGEKTGPLWREGLTLWCNIRSTNGCPVAQAAEHGSSHGQLATPHPHHWRSFEVFLVSHIIHHVCRLQVFNKNVSWNWNDRCTLLFLKASELSVDKMASWSSPQRQHKAQWLARRKRLELQNRKSHWIKYFQVEYL